VFWYVVILALTVVISAQVLLSGDLSILNPVSLFELSVQLRFIWLEDTAVAMRFEGAVGPVPVVVVLAVFEYTELPVALYALIL